MQDLGALARPTYAPKIWQKTADYGPIFVAQVLVSGLQLQLPPEVWTRQLRERTIRTPDIAKLAEALVLSSSCIPVLVLQSFLKHIQYA